MQNRCFQIEQWLRIRACTFHPPVTISPIGTAAVLVFALEELELELAAVATALVNTFPQGALLSEELLPQPPMKKLPLSLLFSLVLAIACVLPLVPWPTPAPAPAPADNLSPLVELVTPCGCCGRAYFLVNWGEKAAGAGLLPPASSPKFVWRSSILPPLVTTLVVLLTLLWLVLLLFW